MFGLIKEINWLIILNNSKLLSDPSASTLIRKVRKNAMPSLPGFMTFWFELDGEGQIGFDGEIRYGITDDEVKHRVESYSKKHLYETQGNREVFVGYGEFQNKRAFFTGKTKKTNLVLPIRFLQKMLENQDYTDESSNLYYHRVWTAGDPFANQNTKQIL